MINKNKINYMHELTIKIQHGIRAVPEEDFCTIKEGSRGILWDAKTPVVGTRKEVGPRSQMKESCGRLRATKPLSLV
jgi:hypothetical protein